MRLARETGLSPPVKYLLTILRRYFLLYQFLILSIFLTLSYVLVLLCSTLEIVSFLVLQLSRSGIESWLHYFNYLLDVIWLLLFFSLPHGAVDWSAMSDCGISWSYSLTFSCTFRILIKVLSTTKHASSRNSEAIFFHPNLIPNP